MGVQVRNAWLMAAAVLALAGCAREASNASPRAGAGGAHEPLGMPAEAVSGTAVPAEAESVGAASEEVAELLAGSPPPPAQFGERGGAECMAPSGAPYVAPSC